MPRPCTAAGRGRDDADPGRHEQQRQVRQQGIGRRFDQRLQPGARHQRRTEQQHAGDRTGNRQGQHEYNGLAQALEQQQNRERSQHEFPLHDLRRLDG